MCGHTAENLSIRIDANQVRVERCCKRVPIGCSRTGGQDEDIQIDQETRLLVLLQRKGNRSGEIFVSHDSVREASGQLAYFVRADGLSYP